MCPLVSLENIHASKTIHIEQVIFRNTYMSYICMIMCMYVHVTINENRRHEFESEQRRVYGRIWSEEREGGIIFV